MAEQSRGQKVLYVISCGSPAAQLVPEFVKQAQAAAWDVCVVATPDGRKFLDVSLLERLTGHPVRSEYKHPDEPDVLPAADVVIAYPATFNTLNKWALGISDTLAVGLLASTRASGSRSWPYLPGQGLRPAHPPSVRAKPRPSKGLRGAGNLRAGKPSMDDWTPPEVVAERLEHFAPRPQQR